MARDDFTKPTKNQAYQRVAGRCSNPDCRATTSAPVGEVDFSNVGVGAHIHAASPGGPRYLAAVTAEDRRGFGNIIWLCQTCSTIIDRDPDSYPAETLKAWKTSAEARALMEQGKRLPDEKDIYRMAAMAMGTRTHGFYPEAIGNVHKALVDQLEAVDPRFTVSTAYSGGNTTITVGAKENRLRMSRAMSCIDPDPCPMSCIMSAMAGSPAWPWCPTWEAGEAAVVAVAPAAWACPECTA